MLPRCKVLKPLPNYPHSKALARQLGEKSIDDKLLKIASVQKSTSFQLRFGAESRK